MMTARMGILVLAFSLLIGAMGIDARGAQADEAWPQGSLALAVAFTLGASGPAVEGIRLVADAFQPMTSRAFIHVFVGAEGGTPFQEGFIQRRFFGLSLGWKLPWDGWPVAPRVRLLRIFSPPEVGFEILQIDADHRPAEWKIQPFLRGGLALISLGPFTFDL